MVFHWGLSDSKSPQVSRTLLSILAVLNNAVVRMVASSPPTSKSNSPFNNPLFTVPKEPITIGIIVTFMFFQFPSKVEILILIIITIIIIIIIIIIFFASVLNQRHLVVFHWDLSDRKSSQVS